MTNRPSPQDSKQSSFGKDVLKLVSGTAVAQALAILAAPILTRLYNPEAFGVAALFVSITGIVSVISCLRYELAIMLPESDEEAANLLGVSLSFVFIITFLSIPLVWFGQPFILNLLNAPELGQYLWLVPPMILFSGGFLALNYWNSRTKQFGRLSIKKILQALTTTGTQLGLGVAGYGTGGSLVSGNIIGTGISTLVLGGQIWRDDSKLLRNSITPKGMIAGIKRHYKFPLYNTWAAFLNNLSWQLPSLMLASFFSPAIVGYYALANRLLKIPMNLIGGSISQVFFQRATIARVEGDLDQLVKTNFQRLVYLGLFPTLLLTVIGDSLFVLVFGDEWSEAGFYTQILSCYLFVNFVTSPLSNLFSVLERQELGFRNQFLKMIFRTIALLTGGFLDNARLTITLFSISGILVYSYINLSLMKLVGISYMQALNSFLSPLKVAFPLIILVSFLKFINLPNLYLLISSFILIMCYYAIIYAMDIKFRVLLSR